MQVNVESKVAGYYKKLEVLDKDGNVKREYPGFPNLILNSGLEMLGRENGYGYQYESFNSCFVGASQTEPAVTDTMLGSHVASTTTINGSSVTRNIEEGYAESTFVYQFAEGAVLGNISELGIGVSNTSGNVFSRTLIKDIYGNPTTITLLSDEILRVTWSLRTYWQAEDTSGVVVNTGNKGGSYSWTMRPMGVNKWFIGSKANYLVSPYSYIKGMGGLS